MPRLRALPVCLLALAACGGPGDGGASDGPGVNELRFRHAELLWDLQRREEASEKYREVVMADPGAPFAERAARRVVQARTFRLCGDPEPDPERRRLPMARWFAQDLEAYDFYLQYFARTEFAAFVRTRRARVFHDHNHFPEAVQALEEIVWRTPAADLPAWQAAHLVDSLRAMGDSAGAAAWASSFREIPGLNGETPDVIPGLVTRWAFCRDPRVASRD